MERTRSLTKTYEHLEFQNWDARGDNQEVAIFDAIDSLAERISRSNNINKYDALNMMKAAIEKMV